MATRRRAGKKTVRDVAQELQRQGIHRTTGELIAALVAMGFAVKGLASPLHADDVMIAVGNFVAARRASKTRYPIIFGMNEKGEDVPQAEVVDPVAPYIRLFEPNLEPQDAGPWPDLEPDVLEMVVSETSGGVRRLASVTHKDGYIRGRLLARAVRRDDWARATRTTRRSIRDAFRAIEDLEAAAVAAVANPKVEIRGAALNLLVRVSELVEKDNRDPTGLQARLRKAGLDDLTRGLLLELEKALNEIRWEGRHSRGTRFFDAAWLAEKSEWVNHKLKFYKGSPPLPQVCTPDLIAELSFSSGKKLARRVLKLADPRWSLQDLGRKKPVVRRRQP